MTSKDEWTTVTKNSKRCARNRKRPHGSGHSIESSKRQQFDLHSSGSGQKTLSLEEITRSLQHCSQEVGISDFFQSFKESLKNVIVTSKEPITEIVCYGFGNFGSSHAPMFQLSFAIAVREILTSTAPSSDIETNSGCCSHGCHTGNKVKLLPMHYYDPCMTQQESIILEQNSIQVIPKNERGQRRVQQKTLFLMPHCPLTLYCNLIHINWDQLDNVIIMGNLLSVYAGRLSEVKPSVKLLQQVQPFWNESILPISKEDLSDRSGQFEQAFNDSGLIHFQKVRGEELFQKPPPSLNTEDDTGETI